MPTLSAPAIALVGLLKKISSKYWEKAEQELSISEVFNQSMRYTLKVSVWLFSIL